MYKGRSFFLSNVLMVLRKICIFAADWCYPKRETFLESLKQKFSKTDNFDGGKDDKH